MQNLTPRDKRTIRIAAIAIAVYLLLFYGSQGWRTLESSRAEFRKLTKEAQELQINLQRYETKVLLVERLQEKFQFDLSDLSRTSLAAEISAAIQKAAQTGGVAIGPLRESPGSAAAKELASMQFECTGPVPAVMALLHRLPNLGFPVIIDSVQLTPAPGPQPRLKATLHLVILDFEKWKQEDRRNA